MKQKIFMLAHSSHTPFDTRIFLKEAITLSKNGYEVSIIIPGSRDEIVNGISIQTVTLHKEGWKRLLIGPWLVFRKVLQKTRASVLHIHDSQLLIIGIWLKLLGYKVIYDAHEDTPEQISYQHWIPTVLKKPYAWFYIALEKIAGWMFNGIIVAEPVIAKYFPKNKTVLIRNFPIVGSFNEGYNDYLNREKRLVHFGMLSEARGVLMMAKASAIAMQRCKFIFQLGGPFSPKELKNKIAEYQIEYRPWVAFDEIVKIMLNSRAGIVVPQPIERYKTNYPVKLFEYMAAGLPVVASKYGELATFVNEGRCGVLVDPENEQEVADAIEFIFQNETAAKEMGERGRALVFLKYSWEKEAETLLSFYQRLFN